MQRSCLTCQKRRRGCDKAKPTCNTCNRDGQECLGYEHVRRPLFVNFNSANVSKQKRQVLKKAIRDRRGGLEKDEVCLVTGSMSNDATSDDSDAWNAVVNANSTSLSLVKMSGRCYEQSVDLSRGTNRVYVNKFLWSTECLYWPSRDFQTQCSVLWSHFELAHSRSSEAWAPRFKFLANKNQALDLALIALSTIRMSQDTKSNETRLLSLTAYDIGLKVYKLVYDHVCDTLSQDDPRIAEMAVTSLIFSMFEAMHESPKTIFQSGWMTSAPHLRGALKLMQVGGPSLFQHGGYHLVFQKLREMAVLCAFCNYEPSFLASVQWMNQPWHFATRSVRDRLHDISTQTTRLVAALLRPTSLYEDTIVADKENNPWVRLYQVCRRKVDDWQRKWESSLSASQKEVLAALKEEATTPRTLLLNPPTEDADTIFLYLEAVSLKLMLELCAARLSCTMKASYFESNREIALHLAESQTVLHTTAEMVERTLTLPVFRQNDSKEAGIVEGQCRSLFPAWTMIEYRRCISQGLI
ncbi:hypothetical protein K431DRAFT_287321 [Polychaeton citri CBS 116435]|uniref:Zn(2)-C6 fungal-type domain-containing protein n=1 Tax=Polychaeton citri CBS 116435 TaxID=1314669 RepID=A0A9P4UNC6_9PEZI|nr:hypothetical protein K431DRAFT_287321 [Polychaeton citri CBS 116435]